MKIESYKEPKTTQVQNTNSDSLYNQAISCISNLTKKQPVREDFSDALTVLLNKNGFFGSILQVCRSLFMFRAAHERLKAMELSICGFEYMSTRSSLSLNKQAAKDSPTKLQAIFCGESPSCSPVFNWSPNSKNQLSGGMGKLPKHYSNSKRTSLSPDSKNSEFSLGHAQKLSNLKEWSMENLMKLFSVNSDSAKKSFEENLVLNCEAPLTSSSPNAPPVSRLCSQVPLGGVFMPKEFMSESTRKIRSEMEIIESFVLRVFVGVYSEFLEREEAEAMKNNEEPLKRAIREALMGKDSHDFLGFAFCLASRQNEGEILKYNESLNNEKLSINSKCLLDSEKLVEFVKCFPASETGSRKRKENRQLTLKKIEEFFVHFSRKTQETLLRKMLRSPSDSIWSLNPQEIRDPSSIGSTKESETASLRNPLKRYSDSPASPGNRSSSCIASPKNKESNLVHDALVWVLVASKNKNVPILLSVLELMREDGLQEQPELMRVKSAVKSIINKDFWNPS